VLALCCLGNLATLVFLLLRWRRVHTLRGWLLGVQPTSSVDGDTRS